jgi:hypothetical protein
MIRRRRRRADESWIEVSTSTFSPSDALDEFGEPIDLREDSAGNSAAFRREEF